jgi:hypothetical protein
LAAGALLDSIGLLPFAGASYLDQTSLQRIDAAGGVTATRIRPDDTWSGVIGMVFAFIPQEFARPPLQVVIEGGLGDREHVMVSLRGEWIPEKLRIR